MARSFSAPVTQYGQGFRPGYNQGRDFGGPVITGGPGYNQNAADLVSLGNSYKSLRNSSLGFDEIGATSIANRSAERATAMQAEAQMHATGLSTLADIKSNKIIADAQKAAARSQAQGSMMGSALGAIGSIGGALLMMSDEKTKENIERIDDALSKLRQLTPVTFNYKEEYSTEYNRMHHGFIAQDYMKVLPDATYNDSSINTLCIDTGDLIGLLVRAVQQLETKVTRLEAKLVLQGVYS